MTTAPAQSAGYNRYGLKKFINKRNLHSYSQLAFERSQAVNNLLMDIIFYNDRKFADRAKRRFPAHNTKPILL